MPGPILNRVSLGQQVRLPDLPRLPLAGSDMHRQRQSAIGRQQQVSRDELLEQMLEKKKEKLKAGGSQRNAAAAQAAFLAGKVKNRIGNGPHQDLRRIQSTMHTLSQAIQ